ncbi:MAG: hypothetical protein NW218_21445 [Saprospiraceae bacterium]|nr:hypothetical protein [Saprospiraceae bacterium]
MQQLVLDIEESRYTLLLQFLKTLDYVKIVETNQEEVSLSSAEVKPENQLDALQRVLKQQKKPLFPAIKDPVSWQKQQRDAWS